MEGTVEHASSPQHYHVVLLGRTGAGKSATANTILGRNAFRSKKSFKSVTQEVQSESVTKCGVNITIYDTPGYFDPKTHNMSFEEPLRRYMGLPGFNTEDPLVYLLVIKSDRFTPEEKSTVEMIEDYLPDKKNTWIIFTRGDELEREDQTIEEFIEDADEELKEIVQRFGNRYFVFNNISQNPKQVINLIDKIKEVKPERRMETDTFLERQTAENNYNEQRLILLGKTGVGKSTTGNTILGKNAFKSERNFNSVTSQSERQKAAIAGKEVSVIDTPGYFDPNVTPKKASLEIARSFQLCSPGPHAFLYVVSLSERFIEADEAVIKNIEKMYGKGVSKYTIPVFTHSDQLEGKSAEELIRQNETLNRFVQCCGGRYHIMNNKDKNRKQVTELLQKIDKMVDENGGSCYSNKLFQDATILPFKKFFNKHQIFFISIAFLLLNIGVVFKLISVTMLVLLALLVGIPFVQALKVPLSFEETHCKLKMN